MLDLFLKCLLFTFDTYQILTYILVICMMANPPYYTKKTMKAGVYLGYLYIKPVMPGTHTHSHTHTHTQSTCYLYKAMWFNFRKPVWIIIQDKPHSSISAVSEERWYFVLNFILFLFFPYCKTPVAKWGAILKAYKKQK